VLAELSAAGGNAEDAARVLQSCIAVAQACGDAALRVQAHSSLGAALAQQGRHDEARRNCQQALATARRMPGRPDLQVAVAQVLAALNARRVGRNGASALRGGFALARACGNRATLGPLLGLCHVASGPEPAARPLLCSACWKPRRLPTS
jgi:hypothetical protein